MVTRCSHYRRTGFVTLVMFLMVFLILCMLKPSAFAADADVYSKQEIEAAYLYNFLLFVRWPQKIGDDLTICGLGDEGFSKSLRPLVGKKIKGTAITLHVNVFSDLRTADITKCSLIFISSAYKDSLSDILDRLRGLPILTVSDISDFVQSGGMLGLVEQHGRLRWQVNQYVVKESGLSLASQLLRNALMVITEPTEGHAQ